MRIQELAIEWLRRGDSLQLEPQPQDQTTNLSLRKTERRNRSASSLWSPLPNGFNKNNRRVRSVQSFLNTPTLTGISEISVGLDVLFLCCVVSLILCICWKDYLYIAKFRWKTKSTPTTGQGERNLGTLNAVSSWWVDMLSSTLSSFNFTVSKWLKDEEDCFHWARMKYKHEMGYHRQGWNISMKWNITIWPANTML